MLVCALRISKNRDKAANEFLSRLCYFLQGAVNPDINGERNRIEIETESCKELYWDVWAHVCDVDCTSSEYRALDDKWDEIVAVLPPPAELKLSSAYILTVSLTEDGSEVLFTADAI